MNTPTEEQILKLVSSKKKIAQLQKEIDNEYKDLEEKCSDLFIEELESDALFDYMLNDNENTPLISLFNHLKFDSSKIPSNLLTYVLPALLVSKKPSSNPQEEVYEFNTTPEFEEHVKRELGVHSLSQEDLDKYVKELLDEGEYKSMSSKEPEDKTD